jgi:hypothetical protein
MTMKKIQLLSIICLLAAAANAQTEKGGFTVSGGLGLQTGESASQVVFNPSFGFFVADNFLLGGFISGNFEKLGETKTNQFGIGPFARYYIGKAATKPFVVTEFDFLSRTTKETGAPDIKTNGTRFLFGLGFAAFINENIAVEGITGYNYSKFKDVDGSGGFTLRLGFGLYFNKRHIKDLKTNVVGEK